MKIVNIVFFIDSITLNLITFPPYSNFFLFFSLFFIFYFFDFFLSFFYFYFLLIFFCLSRAISPAINGPHHRTLACTWNIITSHVRTTLASMSSNSDYLESLVRIPTSESQNTKFSKETNRLELLFLL